MLVWRNNQFELIDFAELHNLLASWTDAYLAEKNLNFIKEAVHLPEIKRIIWKNNVKEKVTFHFDNIEDKLDGESPFILVGAKINYPNGDLTEIEQAFYSHRLLNKHFISMIQPVAEFLQDE